MAINTGKVVVGGIAGGIVMVALDFLVNGLLMADQNTAALTALNPALVENVESAGALAGFIIVDLLFGLLLVWTYAAMRPRFGAGPKTAVIAAVQVWFIAMLLYTGMTVMGIWAWGYLISGAVAYLVILNIAAIVGAMLYKEG